MTSKLCHRNIDYVCRFTPKSLGLLRTAPSLSDAMSIPLRWRRGLSNPSRTGNILCLGCRGFWSADCWMPQRVRMFLEGLARQPGDAISMVATTVGRLVLTQGELMGPEPATS